MDWFFLQECMFPQQSAWAPPQVDFSTVSDRVATATNLALRDARGAPEDAEAHESLAVLKAALLIGRPQGKDFQQLLLPLLLLQLLAIWTSV